MSGRRRYEKPSVIGLRYKSHPLKNRRNALAAAYAHGHQRVAALNAFELVQSFHGDQRAGRANRANNWGRTTGVRLQLISFAINTGAACACIYLV